MKIIVAYSMVLISVVAVAYAALDGEQFWAVAAGFIWGGNFVWWFSELLAILRAASAEPCEAAR